MSKKYFLLLFIFWSLFSCTNTNKVEINSENISVDPEILYIEAMYNFDAKEYDLALDKFEKLEKFNNFVCNKGGFRSNDAMKYFNFFRCNGG